MRATLGALTGVRVLLLASAPVAASAESLTAVYAFSWSGVDVGAFDAEIEVDGGTYRASWQGRTTGFVGTLFPFTSRGASEGRREEGRFAPRRYEGSSEWREGKSAWRVAFGPDGRATSVDVPDADRDEREPVPVGLQVGPDPASLALVAIAAAEPGLRLSAGSFDGRRAIGFSLECGGLAPDPSGNGSELACNVSGRLLAGASRRWRERNPNDEEREPVRVWLRQGVHGGGFWPVRIEAPTRFGLVTARLVSVGREPIAG